MKGLLVLNYKEELSDYDFLNRYKQILDVQVLNENKWRNFAFKLEKLIIKQNYKFVIHRGICWGKDKSMIWDIFLIKRAFLSDGYKIFDWQKYRYIDKFEKQLKGQLKISFSNIVTKFRVWRHSDIIYDWSYIFDLESFWVANLTNLFSIPIITIKWVSDDNNLSFLTFDENKQIEFLLYPELKRKKKQLILQELTHNIKILTSKFKEILPILLKNLWDYDFG